MMVMFMFGTAEAGKTKYKEIEVKNGSTIKGKVTWMGSLPKLPPITVFKHMDKCGQEVVNPALEFTAVYLEKVAEGKALPAKKGKIKVSNGRTLHAGRDIKQRPESQLCNFEQHVFAFVNSRKVGLYNMENLLHNPHAFGSNGASSYTGRLSAANSLIL